MSSASLALYTTVYPAVARYLGEWHRSVAAQTDQDFDLWIGLDGMSIAEACGGIGAVPRVQWIGDEPGSTPASVRQRALERLVDGYAAIVLVDSDDILAPSRVGAARRGLASHDVVGCALELVDDHGEPLGHVLAPADGELLGDLIMTHNVFGLSNSAYRSTALKSCLPVPPECELVDWLLVTRASLRGAGLSFDPSPHMRYRRYDGNVTPLCGPFSAADVLAASRRVLAHYRHLLDGGWPIPGDRGAPFEAARARTARFDAAVRGSAGLLDTYVEALNLQPPRCIWWWCVAHPSLDHIWQT